jgi:hypothetical protein
MPGRRRQDGGVVGISFRQQTNLNEFFVVDVMAQHVITIQTR